MATLCRDCPLWRRGDDGYGECPGRNKHNVVTYTHEMHRCDVPVKQRFEAVKRHETV